MQATEYGRACTICLARFHPFITLRDWFQCVCASLSVLVIAFVVGVVVIAFVWVITH